MSYVWESLPWPIDPEWLAVQKMTAALEGFNAIEFACSTTTGYFLMFSTGNVYRSYSNGKGEQSFLFDRFVATYLKPAATRKYRYGNYTRYQPLTRFQSPP